MSLDRLTAKCPTCGAALVSQEQEDGGLALTYECGAVGLLSEKAAEESRLWEVRWSRMCPEPQRARETERAERIMTSEGIDPAIDREAVAGLTAEA